MERLPDPLHSWRVVEAPPGASDDDAVEAALASGHATLTYGERCFEFTFAVEEGGACFLRLDEVGHLTATGSGRAILVFTRHGYHAERRIVPCRDALDAEVLRDLGGEALQVLGLGLLEDAALGLDSAERS
jgi:aspartate oxidase